MVNSLRPCFNRVLQLQNFKSNISIRPFTVSTIDTARSAYERRRLRNPKPGWVGRAPTKIDIVDPDPTLDAEEQKLLKEWEIQYWVDMDYAVQLMKEKQIQDSLDTGASKRWIREERRHHLTMVDVNIEWNKQVALYREHDWATKQKEEEDQLKQIIDAAMIKRAAERDEALVYVNQLQEDSKDFVSLDNLDEKMATLFEVPIVDYNFAVDKEGNVYEEEEKKLESLN